MEPSDLGKAVVVGIAVIVGSYLILTVFTTILK
jgi:hypothetical protein